MTRLAAVFHGEVSAETVEAYRRAGAVAYQDLLDAERLREELRGTGVDLWSAGPGRRSQLLCSWNAYALQALGDELVKADYEAVPSTVGYLPPVTAEQAAAFLGEVEYWSSRTHRAAADPGYNITVEGPVPAPLPRWVEVEPCPQAHLDAMRAAAHGLRDHAQTALADFTRSQIPQEHAEEADRLAGWVAEADSAVDYADSLWGPAAGEVRHERVENSLKRAIGGYYQVGQLLAAPELLDRDEKPSATLTPRRMPLPGQPGFDPWCLTDPASRDSWRADPQARRAIDTLWRYDPDPAATLGMQAQIDAAVAEGAAERATGSGGRVLGNYFCCPWSRIYVARRPLTLGHQSVRPGEQFTLDVSAEDVATGGGFRRELVYGPFHPTNDVDYCDPTSGGHHD